MSGQGGGGGREGHGVIFLGKTLLSHFHTALTGELFRFPDNMQVGGGGGEITSDGTASHPR